MLASQPTRPRWVSQVAFLEKFLSYVLTNSSFKDIMPYRSHPYPQGTEENPTFDVIYQYQQKYAAKYTDNIRFNRVVTRIRHTPPDHPSRSRWLIEWTPAVTSELQGVGKIFEEGFDHVVVANGSDTRPFIQHTDNLWAWKGDILHSRWYRDAKAFAGKASSPLRPLLQGRIVNEVDDDRPLSWLGLAPRVSR